MKIKLNPDEFNELSEEEQAQYVQPKDEDFFVHEEAFNYGEQRAEKVHSTVKALREELKNTAKPEEVSRLQQDIALRDALEAAGGNRYARSFFADRITKTEDGEYVLKGDNGKILRDDAEHPLSLVDALNSIKEAGDHGTLFNAKSPGGGGGAPRKTSKPEVRDTAPQTPEERQAKIKELIGKGKTMREAIRIISEAA
ncbi:MAG: hypothetical protein NXH95_02560 [Pseudomonadaceae bacterium]|nr:hypothetical protein [Pseudomonadaceae bacterium]